MIQVSNCNRSVVAADPFRHSRVLQMSAVARQPMPVRYFVVARRVAHESRVVGSVALLEETTVNIRVLQNLDWITQMKDRTMVRVEC